MQVIVKNRLSSISFQTFSKSLYRTHVFVWVCKLCMYNVYIQYLSFYLTQLRSYYTDSSWCFHLIGSWSWSILAHIDFFFFFTMSHQYSTYWIDHSLFTQSLFDGQFGRSCFIAFLFVFEQWCNECPHRCIWMCFSQVLILRGELLHQGECLLKGWSLLLNGPPETVPWFILPTDNVWVYKAFCLQALQISVASSLVIILGFSQAQISLPRTCHTLSQPLLLVHILYCFFHTQVLLTWVPFYVLSFQALVTLKRKTLGLAGSEKSSVCFLTTGLCFWGLCCWAVTQGVRRKSTSAENSLEAKYMPKISSWLVTFPN